MKREEVQIDFVIAWVDGNDPEWQKRKKDVLGGAYSDDRAERYFDWDLLRYWFRGVETFAPWVHTVFFLCDQDPPAWLNTEHPRLRIVRHEDFIPAAYLPTFNSHTIELNIFRIPNLSEHFVYFCDDMYLIRPIKPEAFFKNGLPVDCAGLNPLPNSDLAPGSRDKKIFYIPLNDTEYLNREYCFRECIRKHPLKWYNVRYGDYLIRNLFLSSYSRFVGFSVFHLAQPYRRAAFEDAWQKNRDILDATCRHPIRDDHDVSQSFIRYRQLAEGKFVPGRPIKKAVFHITEEVAKPCNMIRYQTKPMICLNDGEMDPAQRKHARDKLKQAFEAILPRRSSFEIPATKESSAQ